MTSKRPTPISRPSPKIKVPDEIPKTPTNVSERVAFFGKNVYRQLTATRFRIFVVGAFPFVAYICTSFVEYQRQRYEFRLQQSTFFKSSIAAIANSPEIRGTYGRNIKLKRASFWTVSSGFVPWIRERHVWLGFSGNTGEGWIRMGLRRSEFVINKDVFKALGKQIDTELTQALKESLKKASEAASVSHEQSQGSVKSGGETERSETEAASPCEAGDQKVEISKVKDDDPTNTESKDCKPEQLTAREIMAQKLLAKEVRDKSHADHSKQYLEKVRSLYPQLSDNFSQNDLEQAIALRKDRELMGQAFDKTWDLLSLSIHPDSKSKDVPVYVLYDPENSYVDQGDYVFDSNFLSVKRKEAKQTELVKRENSTH